MFAQVMPGEVGVANLLLQAGAFGLLAWLAVFWMPRAADRVSASNERVANTFVMLYKDALTSFETRMVKLVEDHKDEREKDIHRFGAMLTMIDKLNRPLPPEGRG